MQPAAPRQSALVTRSTAIAKLQVIQMRIETIARHQFIVRTLFDNRAMIQNDDAMGDLDRTQAVGDDDGRAPLHQPIQRLLY
jgi:hypothetical protein